MADFSRLPNEMISGIWSNIQEPEDVESFALVSKHVYAIGRPFVEEHNRLKKEFSFVDLDPEMDFGTPASLLEEVLLRPRTALYVTHISFGLLNCFWDDESDVDDRWPERAHDPYPDDVMALFIETIRQSSFVPRTETSRWITSVEAGDEDPIFALLCMLLPHLSTVALKANAFCGGLISQETIMRLAETEKTLFLTRLVTVNIECEDNEGQFALGWFTRFAALPSVQRLHIDRMGIDKVDEFIVDYLDHFVSVSYSIKELTFTRSSLHPEILAKLLDSVKGLKSFSYLDLNEMLHKIKPYWIRTALLAHAKHSLEYLAILPPWPDQFELLGTLRGFTALKELETNANLLCHGSAFDGLAQLLPSSIERIHLNTSYCMDYDNLGLVELRIVEEIVKAKSRLIPHLKALKLTTSTIGENRITIESLEEKCENVGIELTLIESY